MTGGIFYGYHFRTSSRFGSYVEIIVTGDAVTIVGRRVSRSARDAWVLAQGVLMALTGLSLIGWLLTGTRRHRRRLVRFALLEYLVASFGALFVWWPADRGERGFVHSMLPVGRAAGEVAARKTYTAASFRLADIRDVEVTNYYSRHGLMWIAWPWQWLMSAMGDKGNTVVFEAPDEENPDKPLVFALQLETAEEAQALAAALRGE